MWDIETGLLLFLVAYCLVCLLLTRQASPPDTRAFEHSLYSHRSRFSATQSSTSTSTNPASMKATKPLHWSLFPPIGRMSYFALLRIFQDVRCFRVSIARMFGGNVRRFRRVGRAVPSLTRRRSTVGRDRSVNVAVKVQFLE